MGVEVVQGDMLESGADAVVIPVNCVGVPGKGLALAAARRWPGWAKAYKAACARDEVRVGQVWEGRFDLTPPTPPRYIVAFPTKGHWKNPSRLQWIEDGLVSLRAWAWSRQPARLAVPALGAGLGGLSWTDVRPLIESILAQAGCDVVVFEPHDGAVIASP